MTYIADKINDEYKTWKLGPEDRGKPDTIFISAPTGSGKTTFVLEAFLPYLAKRKKRLLYLVNRTILKKQLEERICLLSYEQESRIDVKLYQTIENEYIGYLNGCMREIKQPREFEKLGKLFFEGNKDYEKYDCVICDEAHYFLADSNYNTNTIFSYNFVKNNFQKKLRIYMSATIEEIEKIIKKDDAERVYYRTPWFGFHSNYAIGQAMVQKPNYAEYNMERNYDYIDIKLLKEIEEIPEIVNSNETEKWLIFVDNKSTGKQLESSIEKSIFIASSYKKEKESLDEVNEIVKNDKSSMRVLIATSVLDNGINLKDIELRNIIIMVDNEIEFIQMLGRKRKDGIVFKLYLLKQSKDHFQKRLEQNRKKLEIARKCYGDIENMITNEVKNNTQMARVYGQMPPINKETLGVLEWNYICLQHQYLLPILLEISMRSEYIRTLFTSFNGIMFMNALAFKNLSNLNEYYREMIGKFDEYGENAFLREQLRWLGKSDQKREDLVEELNLPLIEKSRKNVIERLTKEEGKKLTIEEYINLHNEIRKDIKILISNVDESIKDRKKYGNACDKNDRAISEGYMKFLNEYCGIPFSVLKEKHQEKEKVLYLYIIKHIAE